MVGGICPRLSKQNPNQIKTCMLPLIVKAHRETDDVSANRQK